MEDDVEDKKVRRRTCSVSRPSTSDETFSCTYKATRPTAVSRHAHGSGNKSRNRHSIGAAQEFNPAGRPLRFALLLSANRKVSP